MQKSIAHYYNKIAKEYTKQHGYDEQLSIPSLYKFLSYLPAKASVLDVGCGGGQDSKFLADNGCFVLGVDISTEMIKLAKKYAPQAKFKIADVADLPAKKKYEGVWCCRMFHHISANNQDKFLDKLKSLLKKGGILYITSAVSEKKRNYELFDLGEDRLLKKRLIESSFKEIISQHGFDVLEFKYWSGKKGMEIFARKL